MAANLPAVSAGRSLPQNSRESCPVTATVDAIGGKWKPLIIHYLLQGTCRFGELRRHIPTATQQMLTLQLRDLERDGLIHREVYAQVPPKVEYSVTPLGRSLQPVIEQMTTWGRHYLHAQQPPHRETNRDHSMASHIR